MLGVRGWWSGKGCGRIHIEWCHYSMDRVGLWEQKASFDWCSGTRLHLRLCDCLTWEWVDTCCMKRRQYCVRCECNMRNSRERWIPISKPSASFHPQKQLSLVSRPLSSLKSKQHQDLEECECNVLGNWEGWYYLLVHSQWTPGCSVSCAHQAEECESSLLPFLLFHSQRFVQASFGQCFHLSTLYPMW